MTKDSGKELNRRGGCIICGGPIPEDQPAEMGNPWPIFDADAGRCCGDCFIVYVMYARSLVLGIRHKARLDRGAEAQEAEGAADGGGARVW